MDTPRRSRLRSRFNRDILRLLALRVGTPLLAAEMYRALGFALSPRMAGKLNFLERREYTYVYLRRLAEKGLVELRGARRRKRVLLTRKGLKALEAMERRQATDRPPSGSGSTHEFAAASQLARAGRKAASKNLVDRFHVLRKELARVAARRGAGAAFISYDIPEKMRSRRDSASRALRRMGYLPVNGSFYIGSAGGLRAALEMMEDLEVLPFCCWGEARLLPP